MNHIASSFVAPDGRSYRAHAWELRDGGYRRLALVLGFPFWTPGKDKRLVSFLLDRGFLVHSLELGFASSEKPRASLSALRAAATAYANSLHAARDLPLYLIAESFSAALVPAFHRQPWLAAAALVAPVLDYPPPGLRMPRCFLSSVAELKIARDSLSGKPELLDGLLDGSPPPLKFLKHDLRQLHAESPATIPPELGAPVGVFAGEDDPFLAAPIRESLMSGGAKLYGYPRVRHLPPFDRYADNFYADFGSFLDEVEAATKRGRQ
ncbi:MAG TPA: hypothetical protein VMC79_06110 [Rectinemataceae bacterium]|nr:hypothetical protein [Rectinemataceae bacterium]